MKSSSMENFIFCTVIVTTFTKFESGRLFVYLVIPRGSIMVGALFYPHQFSLCVECSHKSSSLLQSEQTWGAYFHKKILVEFTMQPFLPEVRRPSSTVVKLQKLNVNVPDKNIELS